MVVAAEYLEMAPLGAGNHGDAELAGQIQPTSSSLPAAGAEGLATTAGAGAAVALPGGGTGRVTTPVSLVVPMAGGATGAALGSDYRREPPREVVVRERERYVYAPPPAYYRPQPVYRQEFYGDRGHHYGHYKHHHGHHHHHRHDD